MDCHLPTLDQIKAQLLTPHQAQELEHWGRWPNLPGWSASPTLDING